MRRIEALTLGILISVNFLCFSPGRSSAQDKGPPTEMIKGAFQEVLRTCDTNRDGKLTLQECMEMWKDRAKAEKNCKYWDSNADGVLTEEEYISQVRKIMK